MKTRRLLMPCFVLSLLASGLSARTGPLIVDHGCVNLYTNLTAADIARVKKMWIAYAGESHSTGIRIGCQLLMNLDSRFQAGNQDSGTPEAATDAHLRVNRATWGDLNWTEWRYSYGEEDWFTSDLAVARTKEGISYCNTNIPGGLDVLAFGWCWDMEWHNDPGGGTNMTYWTRWAGASVGGPDGDLRWGLSSADYSLTGNRVCMDTYLDATEQYRSHCGSNGYPTKVVFTTGPADAGGEAGYQEWVKNEYIRNYVSNTTDGILFDYADILCWDENGRATRTWTDWSGTQEVYSTISPDNSLDLDGAYQKDDGDHIGERGALRLAKALWWMLAKMTEPPSPPQVSAVQIGDGYRHSPAGTTIDCEFSYPTNTSLLSLLWRITPPLGWHLASVVGDCGPTNSGNDILFIGSLVTNPVSFTYTLDTSADAIGITQISAQVEYQLDGMLSTSSVVVMPDPLVITSLHALVVSTPVGAGWPGSVTTCYETIVAQWVTNSPIQSGGTQDVCVGASVEGNDFTQMSPTNVILTLTNDATLTWQWETQYWLSTATNGNGIVTAADGWCAADSNMTLTATAAACWHFAGWGGDTQDCDVADNVITATMSQARTIVASFAENLAPLGTPELWLFQHGLTNDLPYEEETKDTDEDGMFAWQEYVADTDPTNGMSVLSITGVTRDGNSTRVDWKGGEWARQYIQVRQNLTATGELWTSIHTNANLPTPLINLLNSTEVTNDALFYRIKAER